MLLCENASNTAMHDSSARYPPPRCHKESERKVVDFFVDWIKQPKPETLVYWLHAPPACGKSAVIQSIIEQLEQDKLTHLFAGGFFFGRGEQGRDKIDNLVVTIAYQIAVNIPGMQQILNDIVVTKPSLLLASVETQTRAFIIVPLLECTDGAHFQHSPTVLIDGIDECDPVESQLTIINLIGAILKHNVPLRFLFSSRPETHLRHAVSTLSLLAIVKQYDLSDDTPEMIMPPPRQIWEISNSQPCRQSRTREVLLYEKSIASRQAMDRSTLGSHEPTLYAYFKFVHLHDLPIDPTAKTLSHFVTYMSHQIAPRLLKTYMSGMARLLESDYPYVRKACNSKLVHNAVRSCMDMHDAAIGGKVPFKMDELVRVILHYSNSNDHDDFLFVAMLITSFHGIMRIGELTLPEDKSDQDWRKVIRRSSVKLEGNNFQFLLPGHKGDKLFKGSQVVIRILDPSSRVDPLPLVMRYVNSRDRLFRAASPLWLTSKAKVPSKTFFMSYLSPFFGDNISVRFGAVNYLAEMGAEPRIIRDLGRWSPEKWKIYLTDHPVSSDNYSVVY